MLQRFGIAVVVLAAAATAAGAQSGPEIPSVNGRVTSIRFFEMGSDVPELPDRRFAKQFDVASARYISTQIDLEMPAPGRVVDIPIRCVYERPDGSEMGSADLGLEVQPDWTRPFNAQGMGWPEPGIWGLGTYRVRCTHQGRTVAEDSFEIVDAPPTIPSIGGKVATIRFYPSSGTFVEREAREYATRFPATTTRYINLEVQLAHDPPGRVATVDIGCPLVRDDGSLVTTLRLAYEIQPGWRDTFSSTGWGTDAPGWWKPGTYRVYCVAEGALVAEAWFEVVE